jgi:uncharacterized protein (DUF885 family)
MSEVDPTLLNPDERIDYYTALSLASTNALQLTHYREWENNPGLYVSTCVWGCFSLLVREFASLEQRAQSFLHRLREIPDLLLTAKENLKNPGRTFTQVAINITQAALGSFESTVSYIAENVPSLSGELLKVKEAATTALIRYHRWLSDNVLPKATDNFAIGRRAYEELLQAEHYLPYCVTDLIKLGTEVLDNTLEEIKDVAASIDRSLPWRELIMRLKCNQVEQNNLLDSYRNAVQQARSFVIEHDLVTLPPVESLEVCETPPFERSLLPYAAYFPPAPFEKEKKGQLWITPAITESNTNQYQDRPAGQCIYTIPVIALHETYPGHHVQLTHAANLMSPLRKYAMNSLLMEGWALYCEHMMIEEGFCADPRVRLFQLKELLWRACRVIIDIGLHCEEMTIDEAIRILVDKALLDEAHAIAEVRRYTMTPIQPMTYVIGFLLVLDLRERMKEKLKGRFNLKRFHDELLRFGSVSPVLIANHLLPTPAENTEKAKYKRIA